MGKFLLISLPLLLLVSCANAEYIRHKMFRGILYTQDRIMSYMGDPESTMAICTMFLHSLAADDGAEEVYITLSNFWSTQKHVPMAISMDALMQKSHPGKGFLFLLDNRVANSIQLLSEYKYGWMNLTSWNYFAIQVAQNKVNGGDLVDKVVAPFFAGIKKLVLTFKDIRINNFGTGGYEIEDVEKLCKLVPEFEVPGRKVYLGFNAFFLSKTNTTLFEPCNGVNYLIWWEYPYHYPDIASLKVIVDKLRQGNTLVELMVDKSIALALSADVPTVVWTAALFPTFNNSMQSARQFTDFRVGEQRLIHLKVKVCEKRLVISERCTSRTLFPLEWILDFWEEYPTRTFFPFLEFENFEDKDLLPLESFPFRMYIILMVTHGPGKSPGNYTYPDKLPETTKQRFVFSYDEAPGTEPYTVADLRRLFDTSPTSGLDNFGMRLDYKRLMSTPKNMVQELIRVVNESNSFKILVLYTKSGAEKKMRSGSAAVLKEFLMGIRKFKIFLLMPYEEASSMFGEHDGGLPSVVIKTTTRKLPFTAANQTFKDVVTMSQGTALVGPFQAVAIALCFLAIAL